MSKFAELPDGTKLEFPDDTQDSVIDSVVKKHLGVSAPVPQLEAPSYGIGDAVTDFAKGTTGTLAGLADLAVGLPKMAVGAIAAPIRTAIYGDANVQRNVAQEASEGIFGTPSTGLAKLGVPEEYLKGSDAYQAMMKPFELLAQGVESGGEKISEVTGNRELGGTAKQLADIAMLAAPIPGVKLAKKGSAKMLEPFTGAKDATTLRRDLGYEIPKKTNAFMDEVLAQDAAKAVPKQEMPQEPIVGAQMDMFRESPEQIMARQREQAMAESEGIQRDALGAQGDLFIGRGKEPAESIVPPDRTPMEIEGAYAQRDAQRQAEFDIASERMKVADEPLALEPEQSSPLVEKMQGERTTYRPSGQTQFGKGQRGSVGFFGKDSYEKFVEQMKADYPQATPEQVQRAWDKQQAFEQKTNAEHAKAQALDKMASKVGNGLADYLSVWEDKTPEAVIDVINKSADNADTSLGFLSNNLLSKGRLGVVRHENAGVRDGVALMDKVVNDNRIEGNRLLNNHETGVNAIARKMETLFGEGKAGEVFKQIFEKQENPDFAFRLDQNQNKLLGAIKQTTDTIWDSLISTVSKLDAAKAERLAKMKQEWYLPHQFYGDFVSYVRDADGKLLTYIAEATQKDAQRAVEHLREQLGSEYHIDDAVYVGDKSKVLGRKAEEAKRGAAIQEGFAGQFDYMIDLLGSDDPAVIKAQKAVQSVINRRALASESMKNRMKINTNVGGSLGNKTWKSDRENYFDAKKSFENYVQSFYEWKGNMENAEFLAKVREQAPDRVNTYATLKEQFDLISGLGDRNKLSIVEDAGNAFAKINWPGVGKVSPKVINEGAKSIANFEVIQMTGAWNPIMVYQNFVQSPLTQMVTMSQLAAHGASFNPVRAFGHILASIPDSLASGKTNKAWLKYATEHEIALPNLIESHGKTKAGSAAKEWGLAKTTQVSEQTSRIGFFYGMTRYLIEQGIPEPKALELSKNMTREYMVNYNREARPGLLTRTGPIGELAGKLQVFTTNAFTQFAQITAEAAKGLRTGNPKLLIPLGVIVATQYLTGGMNGTIPMDVAEKLHWASAKAGVIPPELRSPRQYMLQEHPKIATSPQSRLIGDWFEGSFRGSLPYTGAPVPQKFIEQLSHIPTALKWTNDFLTGSNTVSNIDKASALQSVLPVSGRGAIEKSYLMNKSGVMISKNTGNPVYKMPKDEQDDFTSNTNIRSYERGRIGELSSMEFQRQSRVADARKALENRFNEKIADTVNMGEKIDPEFFKKSVKRDFELGGDIDTLIRRALDKAVKANLPNAIVAELIRDEKNPFKQQRMMQTYKAIQQETR